MGLNVCKRIVTYFGGDLRVNSEFGKGSTFTFTIIVNDFSTDNDMGDDNNYSMIDKTASKKSGRSYSSKITHES